LTLTEVSQTKSNGHLYTRKLSLEENAGTRPSDSFARFPVSKSLRILELLLRNGDRKTVYTVSVGQGDLARELQITRQALSLHFKKLRGSGLVQVGRGFINVTEEGSKAIGYRGDPVIVNVRIVPQKRSEAIQRINQLPAIEIYRVTGDADIVLILEQSKLDPVLEALSGIDGVVETRSLVSISCR